MNGSEMSRWEKRAVWSALVISLALCAFSMISRKSLYPFDPFQMYSSSFRGKVRETRLLALLKDGQSEVLLQFGSFTEDRLEELALSPYYSGAPDFFAKSSQALATVLAECVERNCEVRTSSGPIPIAEVAGLRVVRNFYRKLTAANFGHPDRVRIVGEARRPMVAGE